MELLELATKNPLSFSKEQSIDNIVNFLTYANDKYRNTEDPVISDEDYDIIIEMLEERDPSNKFLNKIGELEPGDKFKLKYPMASMNKIKDIKTIKSWLVKYPGDYVISDKLDGLSGMIIIELESFKIKNKSMYSRGNGIFGRDLTHLLSYIKLPNDSNIEAFAQKYDTNEITIRGELIISKEDYEIHKDNYSSARNMTNSVINSKTVNPETAKYLSFIVFELIVPNLTPRDSFTLLNDYGFKIPFITEVHEDDIKKDNYLFETLTSHREMSSYNIDGIIVTHNGPHKKIYTENPKYSFAYKCNVKGQLTTITNITYEMTKYGKLNPRIHFNPVNINGSNVKCCNGKSAKYILEQKLNIGSKIRVVLSGDVIPDISEIIEHSDEGFLPDEDYYWDKNSVHIYTTTPESHIEIKIKKLCSFFKIMKIGNISEGIITRLVESEYNTVDKILSMKPEDYLAIEGFKNTLATKLYNNIHKVIDNPIKLETLMAASLCFPSGLGLKRLQLILKAYPNIIEKDTIMLEEITKIDGFSDIMATQFIKHFHTFKQWLKTHYYLKINKTKKLIKKCPQTNNKYEGKNIVLTGFRDDKIISDILSQGGNITNTVNKKTSMVIVKSLDYTNSKIDKAKELGVKIMSMDELMSLNITK
tara:strand:+ start:975 stop:2912 length:1938 start_codon:yes stop_codon:yes gene_type:complete